MLRYRCYCCWLKLCVASCVTVPLEVAVATILVAVIIVHFSSENRTEKKNIFPYMLFTFKQCSRNSMLLLLHLFGVLADGYIAYDYTMEKLSGKH